MPGLRRPPGEEGHGTGKVAQAPSGGEGMKLTEDEVLERAATAAWIATNSRDIGNPVWWGELSPAMQAYWREVAAAVIRADHDARLEGA